MSKLIRNIIIGLIVLFFSASLGGYFLIKDKIKPELVKQLIIENIEKTLPLTKVEIIKINYTIGFKVRFYLKGFSLKLKNNNRLISLLKVNEIEISIPLLSMLTGGAKAKIRVKSPIITLESLKKNNNWQRALTFKQSKENIINKGKEKTEISQIVIPGFLRGNSLSFEILDSSFNYNLGKDKKGTIELEKFIIRNLNFKSSTAFEINSLFKLNTGDQNNISFRLLVLGELNVLKLIQREKNNRINTRVHIQNLKLPGEMNIPNIDTNITVTLNEKYDADIVLKTKLLKNVIDAHLFVDKKNIFLKTFNSLLFFDDLLKISNQSMPNFEKLKLHISGTAHLQNNTVKKIGINWKLNPTLTVNSCLGQAKISSFGSVKTKSLSIQTKVNILGGDFLSKLNMKYDLSRYKTPLKLIKKISLFVTSNGVFIKKENTRNCYAQNSQKTNTSKEQSKQNKVINYQKYFSLVPFLPSTKININLSNLKLGEFNSSLKAYIVAKNKKLEIKSFLFKSTNGFVKLSGITKIKNKSLVAKFKSNTKRLNLAIFQFALPQTFEKIGGVLSSNSEISSLINKKISYNVNNKMKISDFYLDGLDLSFLKKKADEYKKYTKKVPGLGKTINNFNPKSKFKLFRSFITLNEKKIKLKYANISGFSGQYNIKSRGFIIMDKMLVNSEVFIDMTDLNNKNIEIPLRLKLMPDYGYTAKKIISAELLKQKKKLVKKAKKRLKKEANKKVEKLKKDAGKKLKKLFKSFF